MTTPGGATFGKHPQTSHPRFKKLSRTFSKVGIQSLSTSPIRRHGEKSCSLCTTQDSSLLSSSNILLAFVLIRKFYSSLVASSKTATSYHASSASRLLRGGADNESIIQLDKDRTLWSGGVYKEDVNDLVDACLRDPDINIAAVPDWLEKQIYRSTITLVLNTLHRGLNGIHGKHILNHEFKLTRLPRRKSRIEGALSDMGSHVNDEEHVKILEDLADRLLANKSINQPLIPDALERQLYANCLKIVFRVLDLVAVSFRISMCGHDLKLSLEPSDMSRSEWNQAALERVAARTNSNSSLSRLNMERMMEVARRLGAETEDRRSVLQKWLSPVNNDFVAQIHASVYCLILGILDDLLDKTEIQLLSDRIEFDLVPISDVVADPEPSTGTADVALTLSDAQVRRSNAKSFFFLVVGVAVGYALGSLVDQEQLASAMAAVTARATILKAQLFSSIQHGVSHLCGVVTHLKARGDEASTADADTEEEGASEEGAPVSRSWFSRIKLFGKRAAKSDSNEDTSQ